MRAQHVDQAAARLARGATWRALVSLGACVGVAACAGSLSGPSVSEVDGMFIAAAGSWDRNKDGVVTCDEWKAYAAELFASADVNRDGSLTAEEFARLTANDKLFVVANFAYFDQNRDGKVDRSELVDRRNPAFTAFGGGAKCELTSAELAASRTTLRPPSEPASDKSAGPPSSPGSIPGSRR